jgi:hypothetical protein
VSLSPERALELARGFGLDEVPVPRYDDVPEGNAPSSTVGLVTFKKSIMLVDHLRTVAFHRYLHDSCVIDQTMDASQWSPKHSYSVMVRTDVPPPVNERITRATGIKPTQDDRDFFQWLANVVWEQWTIVGAVRMAPPLIFAGGDQYRRWSKREKVAGARPFMGVISKYEVGGPRATYGVITPHDMHIADDHRMVIKVEDTDTPE